MQFSHIITALAALALTNAAAVPEPVLSGADPSPEALAALEARGVAAADQVASAKAALQKHCGGGGYAWGGCTSCYNSCACGYAAGAGIGVNILGLIGIGIGAGSAGVGPCY
ncbi:hypothetical protein HII31_00538 [Pseudocercospora fuligena]|uniref:Uncharacterized protein n=1 Tax=Pseudocercospora fuligena TaxID=685502 RepID=A0A8H6RVH8_9PEZI|nr:hypothetical protein HII31_00538 [Pseudocercospora fuligena]